MLVLLNPGVAIIAGYAFALLAGWWLVSEVFAGRWTPLALFVIATVAFLVGLKTGLSAQPAPSAADAADPMGAVPHPAAQQRPLASGLDPVRGI